MTYEITETIKNIIKLILLVVIIRCWIKEIKRNNQKQVLVKRKNDIKKRIEKANKIRKS